MERILFTLNPTIQKQNCVLFHASLFFPLDACKYFLLPVWHGSMEEDQSLPWMRIYKGETDKSKCVAHLLAFSAKCRKSWCKGSLLGWGRRLLIFRYLPAKDFPHWCMRDIGAITVAKFTGFGTICSGFKFWLCYSPAVVHGACYFTSLCLSLLLCKMRVTIVECFLIKI